MAAVSATPGDKGGRVGCLLACLGLLALGAAAQVWFLLDHCSFDLAGDEAYYWQWARRLDWSYADTNGPLTAYVIAAGRALLADWSVRMVGSEALAVRLPAIALSMLTGLGIYMLALGTLRRPRVALGAVALTCTIPILAAGAGIMTIDAPLACAWTWALVSARRALARGTLAPWLVTGVLIAVGLLAKYNMVLLFPTVGLLLLIEPELRPHLRRPGPYVATLLGFTGLLPILLWNARHSWVSFRQVAGQAGVSSRLSIDPTGALDFIGGQIGVVGLLWIVGIVWALVEMWRRPVLAANEPHPRWAMRLLVLAAAVPWLVFLGFSVITKVQPNWPVLALVGGVIVLAAWLARHAHMPDQRRRVWVYTTVGVVLGGATVVLIHRTDWLTPALAWLARGSPPLGITRRTPPWELTPIAQYDPTIRMRGWAQLGAAVGEVLKAEERAGRAPFILAGDYMTASELAFYTPGQPTVYSAQSVLTGRRSQYDFWPNPIRDRADFVGRPCLYVGSLSEPLTGGENRPAALPDLRPVRTVEYKLAGEPAALWTIFVCDAFAGFDPSMGATPQSRPVEYR